MRKNLTQLRFRGPFENFNAAISSRYGWRERLAKDPNDPKKKIKVWKHHYGVDYAVPMNTPVLASEKGRVIRAALNKGSNGHLIIIDHVQKNAPNRHLYTLYSHLGYGYGEALKENYQKLYPRQGEVYPYNVSVGQIVEKGDVLGFSGHSGSSDGPHLHFELVDSKVPLVWNRTKNTGVDPNTNKSSFKDPLKYIGVETDAEYTYYDAFPGLAGADEIRLTDEDLDRLPEKIKGDLVYEDEWKFNVCVPGFQEFLKEIGKEGYAGEIPGVRLRLKVRNELTAVQKELIGRINLAVNGEPCGTLDYNEKHFEFNVWKTSN